MFWPNSNVSTTRRPRIASTSQATPVAVATSVSKMNPGLTPLPRIVAPPARAAASISAAAAGSRVYG